MKVNPDDADAIHLVTCMDALFLIERAAREQGVSSEERQVLREKESTEWVEAIHADCLKFVVASFIRQRLGQSRDLYAEPVGETQALPGADERSCPIT